MTDTPTYGVGDASYQAAGGIDGLRRLVNDFYDLMEQRPEAAAIPGPTYNEHARAFRAAGLTVTEGPAPVRVVVHPNNPDGRLWQGVGCCPEQGLWRVCRL